MKICYLITAYDFGGAEKQVADLCKMMKAKLKDVCVISILKPNYDFITKNHSEDINYYSLGLNRDSKNLYKVLKLFSLIRRINPDIVHSHMVHANLLSRMIKIFFPKIILINTIHNIDEEGKLRLLLYKFSNFLVHLTTSVTSKGVNKYLEANIFKPSELKYLPNGIIFDNEFEELVNTNKNTNLLEFLSSDYLFLTIGRLEPQKDYFNLIEAVNLLRSVPNFKVLIIGDGSQRIILQKKIKNLELSEKILLLGNKPNVKDYYNKADCFLLSSKWEGLPIVLLEAALYKLPIIATNVGDNFRIIKDGLNGYLVEPSNPKLLSIAMKKMIHSNSKKLFGQRSHNLVRENFNMEKISDNWYKIYSEVKKN